jgi:hypothetical protein
MRRRFQRCVQLKHHSCLTEEAPCPGSGAVQWAIVGPLTALPFASVARKEHAAV